MYMRSICVRENIQNTRYFLHKEKNSLFYSKKIFFFSIFSIISLFSTRIIFVTYWESKILQKNSETGECNWNFNLSCKTLN